MFSFMDEEGDLKTCEGANYGTPAMDPVYTLNELYTKIGSGKAQRIYWSILTLAVFMDEIEQTLLGLIMPFLKCEWHLSLTFEASFVIVFLVFYGIGGIIWGKLSNKFGRKRILFALLAFLLISAIGSATSHNEWIFLLFKAATGFAMGRNFAVALSFASELAESKKRAVSATLILFGNKISILLTVVLAYILLVIVGWRVFVLVISSPLVAAIVLIYFLPESPRFFVVSGRSEEAKKVLLKMAKLNNKEEVEDKFELQDAASEDRGKLAMLLLPEYRRETIILSVTYFSNILIFFSFQLFLPMALNSGFCGATGETPEFKCRHVKQESLLRNSIATCGAVVGLFAAFISVDMFGRLMAFRIFSGLLLISLVLLFKCINVSVTVALLFCVQFSALHKT